MKTETPFAYRHPARSEDLDALWEDMSEQDRRDDTHGVLSREFLSFATDRCRSYVLEADGRLAGICFVGDAQDRREMCFYKTRWLCERRPLAYARGVRWLLGVLARLEAEAGKDAKPMYFHAPDDGGRAAAFFVRAGCRQTDIGLLVPGA